VLRRVSGPNREATIGGWRKMDIKEFYDLYSLLNITEVIK
jgi:hypothetical protein